MSDTKISEAAVYGIRVKGNPVIVGVLPVPLKDFPVKNPEWDERYEEVPLYLHPQPAELAEQKGDMSELLAEMRDVEDYFDDVDPNPIHLATVQAAISALAATGKQQVGEVQGPAAFVEHFTDRLTTLALTPLGLELGVGKHPLYAARQPGVQEQVGE